MATVTSPSAIEGTLAEMLQRLGNVPLSRVRTTPPPGTATEEDVTWLDDHCDRLCELVDGVLVEKTTGYAESILAGAIIEALRSFVRRGKLGVVLAPDGTLKILPDQVRIPDVCFISWQRFPGGKLPPGPIPAVAPDLAIEVLSASNTEGEMNRKLHDYFEAGIRLVWYIDPRTRTARAYTAPDACIRYAEDGVLSAGEVLPGFQLSLRELFAELDEIQ